MRLQLGPNAFDVSTELLRLGQDVNECLYPTPFFPGDCATFALQTRAKSMGLEPSLAGIKPDQVIVSSEPFRPATKPPRTKLGEILLMQNQIYGDKAAAVFHYAVDAGGSVNRSRLLRKPQARIFISRLGGSGPVVLSPYEVLARDYASTHVSKIGEVSIQGVLLS
ncbi:MAG: hypothetical protein WBO35_04485 [Candidatus Saccharimonadales bacterium]